MFGILRVFSRYEKENVPQRDCSSENSPLVNSVPVKEVIICCPPILGAVVIQKNEMVSMQCYRLRCFTGYYTL